MKITCIIAAVTFKKVPSPPRKRPGSKLLMLLYVSNIGLEVTKDSLEAVFSTHGEVNSLTLFKVTKDNETTSTAFVDMEDAFEAEFAIMKLNGTILNDRVLNVRRTETIINEEI